MLAFFLFCSEGDDWVFVGGFSCWDDAADDGDNDANSYQDDGCLPWQGNVNGCVV